MNLHRETASLLGIILLFLVIASVTNAWLQKRGKSAAQTSDGAAATLDNLRQRIATWWVMSAVFALAALLGTVGATLLFALLSFMALREFITLTPTRRGDHRVLFWVFFVIAPVQYFLVASGNYGMFTILIPVYAFLFVPARIVLSGDSTSFLERTAKIQWGLMICVYCLSHAPALLTLSLRNSQGPFAANTALLLFLMIVTQISDVLQYVFGKTLGRHKIAPAISPNKTWEGFIGGTLSASLLGACVWWATPFNFWQAGALSMVITLLGFVGGLTMSAIKRDRGVKDFGGALQGHGGFLDRIDSLCFAAPVFFHLTRYFFT